jgi:putative membrane protein
VSVQTTAGVPFHRLHPLTPLLRGWKVFAAVAAIATQQLYGGVSVGWLLAGIAASIPVAAAYGYVSWRFTHYLIDGGDLRLETGVLFRRSRRVRLDRLQAVDVVRPLVARVLGLAELRLEVAGGDSSEAPLAYLSEPAAQALRAELLARAAGLHSDTPEAPEAVLVRVPLRLLVQSQLLSVGVMLGLAALLVVAAVMIVLSEWQMLAFVIPLALTVVPAVITPVLSHFDFTLADSPDGLRLRHGLLETRAQTVPPGRIQALRIVQPLLWRSRDWCRVEVNVAGYSGEEAGQTSVLLPVATLDDAFTVLRRVLPDVDVEQVALHGVPHAARLVDPWGWKVEAAGADDRVFVARRGRFRRETDIVPHERVQSVRVTQGPLQRRLKLATMHLDTSPGPVKPTAAHRDAVEARRLVDAEVDAAHRARGAARPERWMHLLEQPPHPTVGQ